MLAAPRLRSRISTQICAGGSTIGARLYASNGNGKGLPNRSPRVWEADQRVSGNGKTKAAIKETADIEKPSLFEQLFPDQHVEEKAPEKQRESDIPRLPIQLPSASAPHRPLRKSTLREEDTPPTAASRQRRNEMAQQRPEISVLALNNATKNLLEDDFRRLIPKGEHMEGWKLEQGDILKVLPDRDANTLAQGKSYYLLFSSALSAFTYQGHVTRIHRLVAAHTPASILSPIPPPPGYLVQGIDAHEAIEAFSLVPPTQKLELRQLKPPLDPRVQSIVQHGGHDFLLNRRDRMPFEARITLEGPQMNLSALRHVFVESARARALGWSGDDENLAPRLTKWEPLPSGTDNPSKLSKEAEAYWSASPQVGIGASRPVDRTAGRHHDEQRRTPTSVYIAGFHTKRAMQSFVQFWHRRPLEWEGVHRLGGEEQDLAPITNVEVLW